MLHLAIRAIVNSFSLSLFYIIAALARDEIRTSSQPVSHYNFITCDANNETQFLHILRFSFDSFYATRIKIQRKKKKNRKNFGISSTFFCLWIDTSIKSNGNNQ